MTMFEKKIINVTSNLKKEILFRDTFYFIFLIIKELNWQTKWGIVAPSQSKTKRAYKKIIVRLN
jgi:hypothetical protein